MERIRILFIVAGIAIGDQVGSAEKMALQAARQLDRTVFETRVFSMWGYGSAAEKYWLDTLTREGIVVEGMIPARENAIAQYAPITARFWQCLDEYRPQIVNSHSQRADPLSLIARWLHPVHARAVRTSHLDQPWLERPLMVTVQRLIFPFAFDAEIGISKSIQSRLDGRWVARLLGKKAWLIYNGIDRAVVERSAQTAQNKLSEGLDSIPTPRLITVGRSAQTAQNKLSEGLDSIPTPRLITVGRGAQTAPEGLDSIPTPRLITVGRLSKQKGYSYLLRAMQIAAQQRRQAPPHLLIAGSGPLEQELKQEAAALGAAEYVHFLGSRSDVLDLLPHAQAFVSSSLWEGFPSVILEAMAGGVPVIATDIPGSREMVQSGETGVIAPPANAEALAEAIGWMLDHPREAEVMAKTARARMAKFTLEAAIGQFDSLFRSLV